MSDKQQINLYEDEEWIQNLGEKTVHAKRVPGKFRTIKWLTSLVWLSFFLGPYLTYKGKQAILLDFTNRQYHFFDLTVLPQDVWLLVTVLMFAGILLAVVTAIAGRVFCGYFCFQTVWTDVFTKIEEWIEGAPVKRRKLDDAPWGIEKIWKKGVKHFIWILIGLLSGITWMLWFGDTWADILSLNLSTGALAGIGGIAVGVYVFAGFMREQTCLWVCPYARIQGVMTDTETLMPTYDYVRGETRGKLVKGEIPEGQGDCIDCKQCIAVCPTGVDIRKGQEYGCITCGLCIDVCDSVMEKINKPKGLIRYTTLNEFKYNKKVASFYKRPRVLIYSSVLLLALSALVYGVMNLGKIELTVLHERQPLFVQLSDGSIQNKYELKILNKTNKPMPVDISIEKNDKFFIKKPKNIIIPAGEIKAVVVYVYSKDVKIDTTSVRFLVKSKEAKDSYISKFFTPRR
ncbi:Type cbb3 cytochrome oxidase biogenesis protein CcoG, involved in Cu oxidation [hydrothermal vent metagenome]|uniref:Type cbb3 cytochrome oxidase biogenesis protein CcoG, involved in Cu oxidation n=1 Tax=hydrothermal vent metagenome TaxID=652676 RepID=A0A1W1CRA0_9ZZZZ